MPDTTMLMKNRLKTIKDIAAMLIHGDTLNHEPMKPAAPVISAPRTATVASQ